MAVCGNHLIDSLPARARTRLLSACQTIDLAIGEVLREPGTPTRHVYFPVGGFLSLTFSTGRSPSLEVGMIGSEGMLGVELALGVDRSPFHVLVQGPGAAFRIGAAAFCAELARAPALRRIVYRYVHVLLVQTATSIACHRFHPVSSRLARWLLMTRDRADADHFPITQAFLGYMLGVRRVGITSAAGDLQRDGLIEYHRGALTVLDGRGLESRACSCYADDRRVYGQMLP